MRVPRQHLDRERKSKQIITKKKEMGGMKYLAKHYSTRQGQTVACFGALLMNLLSATNN